MITRNRTFQPGYLQWEADHLQRPDTDVESETPGLVGARSEASDVWMAADVALTECAPILPAATDEIDPSRLTARQQDVLALLCQGLSNKMISRRLTIAVATVKVHVGAILRELRVTNRLQAVLAAQRLRFRCDDAPQAAEPARQRAAPGSMASLLEREWRSSGAARSQ